MGGWATEGKAASPGPPASSSPSPTGGTAGPRVAAGRGSRPECLRAGGRRSEGCTCVRVCLEGMRGAAATRRAGRGRGTHLGGRRGRWPGVPAPAAGRKACCPPAGRRAGEAPRTDGREGAAAARARRSRALSRRGQIAGRRCRRRRRAGGRRAAQCGPGRAGPRGRPPPPLARAAGPRRRPLAAALHHCYVTGRRAGRPGGPAEKLGET